MERIIPHQYKLKCEQENVYFQFMLSIWMNDYVGKTWIIISWKITHLPLHAWISWCRVTNIIIITLYIWSGFLKSDKQQIYSSNGSRRFLTETYINIYFYSILEWEKIIVENVRSLIVNNGNYLNFCNIDIWYA